MSYELSETPKFHIRYGNDCAFGSKYIDKHFPIGIVRLTDAGMAIAGFITEQIIPSHFEAVKKYMESSGVKFMDALVISDPN